MHLLMRSIVGVVAGVVVAFALVAAIEWLGHQVYPIPAGLDFTDRDTARRHVQALPVGALLFVLAGWVIATFGGGIVAASIARRRPRRIAGIVGVVVLLATVTNLLLIPHPVWFAGAGIVGIVAAAYAAGAAMSIGSPG